jgi:hypothetical protein
VVLTSGRDGQLEVADGQQRLATTTILLAGIRDYFNDRHDERRVTSLEEFLLTIVFETGEIQPRLKLNVDDNEFFRRRVLEREGHTSRTSVQPEKPSHDRIDHAANLAAEFVEDILRPYAEQHRLARLNRWVDYIENSAQVIVLKVPDDVNAFVMFETLNDRGLRTSQADLVKNYLFGLSDDRVTEAQQKWATMNGALETLDEDEITLTYLRHLAITLFGHVRERELMDRIKGRVTGKQQALELLDAMAASANDYVAILTPTHAKWNDYRSSIRDHIRTMALLQMTPMRPLALAVATRFPNSQAEKAFQMFVYWSVRLLIAGGGRSGVVEEAFNKAM